MIVTSSARAPGSASSLATTAAAASSSSRSLWLSVATEALFCAGSGAFGVMSILQQGGIANLVKYVGLTTVSAGALLLLLENRERRKQSYSERSVVIVTGCDSGLGFNIAQMCHRMGFVVFAGCLHADSEGAKLLQEMDGKAGRLMLLDELDITLEERIMCARQKVKDFFKMKPNYELFALVNNAGVMCFGEFEWQLEQHLEQQINVNLLGTMKMTKAFLPLLRQHRGRVVNVTSHCSLQALPGLSVYSATKAALRYWTEALRMELSSYGVPVVNFIPGSLVMQSNICANQQHYAEQMRAAFSEEQANFYGSYFDEYNAYLRVISGTKPVHSLAGDHPVLARFEGALLDAKPKALYKCEPWRYKIYYFLFRITPTAISDWLVRKFVAMPVYKTPEARQGQGIIASL